MSLLPPEVGLWLAASLVALSFVTSMLTASAGLGGGVIMLAAIASTVPPAAVIPVHGVIQLGSNSGRAVLLAGHVVRPVLGYFAAGALVGALVGGQLYVNLPGHVLKLVIALFILYTVWGPKFRRVRIASWAYSLAGFATSFVTMFVGGTGPFVAAFISPDRFGKEQTVATHAACMTLQHGFKVLIFGLLGFAFGPWLALMAAMVAGGFLGTMAGRAVLLRLPERAFKIAFKTVLTLLALRLLWSALQVFVQG
jgi:uncharacterized membrane protein YfcA